MERQKHILVVYPHPDDETGISGTLAWHIQQGTPVTYLCLTSGEMGRNMGNPIIANRATLPAIRLRELEESCRSIGIQDLRLGGFHDKTIEFEDQAALIQRIDDVIAEINPSLIITFHPEYSVHPDHNACGAAVIRTVERMPKETRPIVHCVAFAKGCEEVLGQPDVVFDATPFFPIKLASFYSHRSQFQGMLNGKTIEDPEIKSRFSRERFWMFRFS